MLHQPDAAQDERAHHDITNVRLGEQQLAEVGAADAHHLAALAALAAHAPRDEGHAVAEQVEFAGELARGVGRHHLRPAAVPLVRVIEDFNAARDHDEEVNRALAAREQRRAPRQALDPAEALDALDLLGTQLGENFPLALVGVGVLENCLVERSDRRHGVDLRATGLAGIILRRGGGLSQPRPVGANFAHNFSNSPANARTSPASPVSMMFSSFESAAPRVQL